LPISLDNPFLMYGREVHMQAPEILQRATCQSLATSRRLLTKVESVGDREDNTRQLHFQHRILSWRLSGKTPNPSAPKRPANPGPPRLSLQARRRVPNRVRARRQYQ